MPEGVNPDSIPDYLALVGDARVADALVRCGRAGDAAVRLRRALARPLERVEPESADYARMLLAGAWMEAPRCDDEAVRTLLE